MPGEPADHRQEAPHAAGDIAPVGGTVGCGCSKALVIVDHAARLSLGMTSGRGQRRAGLRITADHIDHLDRLGLRQFGNRQDKA